jgi:hypothetical protein
VYLGAHLWNRSRSGVFACAVDGVPVERPDAEKGRAMKNDPSQVYRRDDAHEALVDRETFDRVQTLLARNKEHSAPCRSKRVYLFSGVLRCGTCGAAMAGRASRKLPPSYWCHTYNNGGRSACDPNRISEARFLAALAAKLKERFNPDFLAAFAAAARMELEQGKASSEGEVKALRARLAELDAQVRQDAERILRVLEALLPAVQAAALDTQEKRSAATAELAALEARPAEPAPDVEEMIRDAGKALEEMLAVLAGDPLDARAFFRDNIDHVDVYFNPPQDKGDRTERFARALVYVREDSPLVYLLSRKGSCSSTGI